MKILITGGTGSIGKFVVKNLISQGFEVTLLCRAIPKEYICNCNFILADICELDDVPIAPEPLYEFDVLLHMASFVPKQSQEDLNDLVNYVNIDGTKRLLDKFGSSVKKIVYVSTAEVYGGILGDCLISEKIALSPETNYAKSKAVAEDICLNFGRQYEKEIIVLRLSVVYGLSDPISRAIPNFIKKALENKIIEVYGGNELRDYVHVRDVVTAIELACTISGGGTVNVASGFGITVLDAAHEIVAALNSRSKIIVKPRQKRAVDLVFDISGAKNLLGYQPKYIFPNGLLSNYK